MSTLSRCAFCCKPVPERIIAAAIRQYGLTITLPAPARHHHLLNPLAQETGVLVYPGDQGFLTDTGRFVERREAAAIALEAGQIASLKYPPELYSEDLW